MFHPQLLYMPIDRKLSYTSPINRAMEAFDSKCAAVLECRAAQWCAQIPQQKRDIYILADIVNQALYKPILRGRLASCTKWSCGASCLRHSGIA